MKIVEATILVPVLIIISVMIIGLMMDFYDDLGKQIGMHENERPEIYENESVW